jgi:hypothetical protein
MSVALNRTLLKGIATTFQTALVFGHTTVMIGALCALYHKQPAKLASTLFFLPSFLCAAFIDAYPAEGRAGTSRLFFALNSISLVLLQVGLAFGITRIDELVVEMYGGWRFKASELAAGAINSLIPFALRNLVASIQRPDTLAVRQSDVVCVYLDEHALRMLRAVHDFLFDLGRQGQPDPVIDRALLTLDHEEEVPDLGVPAQDDGQRAVPPRGVPRRALRHLQGLAVTARQSPHTKGYFEPQEVVGDAPQPWRVRGVSPTPAADAARSERGPGVGTTSAANAARRVRGPGVWAWRG